MEQEVDPILAQLNAQQSSEQEDPILSELNKATTQNEVVKKKSTHFYIECGRWYIHIGIRTTIYN